MSKTDKVIKYIRYADDFILGVKGDKADCERIKRQLSDFISQTLKMELSEQKTLITHSNQYARFLGYDIRVRRDQKLKPHGNHVSRTLNGSVELCIPFADKIMPFLFGKSVIRQLGDCLTNNPANRVAFTKPARYNREDYASIVEDVWTGRNTDAAMQRVTPEMMEDRTLFPAV